MLYHIKKAFNLTPSDKNPAWNPEVGRVINEMSAKRLQDWMDEVKKSRSTEILIGGNVDVKNLYLSPTIVVNPPEDS